MVCLGAENLGDSSLQLQQKNKILTSEPPTQCRGTPPYLTPQAAHDETWLSSRPEQASSQCKTSGRRCIKAPGSLPVAKQRRGRGTPASEATPSAICRLDTGKTERSNCAAAASLRGAYSSANLHGALI